MTVESGVSRGGRVLRALLFNRLSLLLLGLLVAFLIVELGLRGVFAARVGSDVLLYGTRFCCGPAQLLSFDPARAGARLNQESHTVHVPEVEVANYRKYDPGQTRLDYTVEGESFEVRINNHGFRGDDFAEAKAPGVTRIVTLGASSTFGYRSRDDETYPVVLQNLLNHSSDSSGAAAPGFEVINLGIPHLWSGQILALLEAEALLLAPDVVTLYAGMNDAKPAARFRDRPSEYRLVADEAGASSLLDRGLGFSRRVLTRLSDKIITAALVRNLLPQRGLYDAEQLRRFSDGKADEFIDNVAAMRAAVEGAGATFIVISQQAHYSDHPRPVAGVTYEESVRELKEKLNSDRKLNLREIEFLTHASLMDELKSWSEANSVPFVDGIGALDTRRDLMASYVHLTPEANRILAAELAAKIRDIRLAKP